MTQQHEVGLQIGIVHALLIDFMPADLIFLHIPNGGIRHKAEAVKLKKMGVLPGAGDLLCHWPVAIEEDGETKLWMDCGYIEVKTDGGGLSDEQIEFRRRVKAMGGKYAVARKYETVRDTLVAWGVRCQNRVRL